MSCTNPHFPFDSNRGVFGMCIDCGEPAWMHQQPTRPLTDAEIAEAAVRKVRQDDEWLLEHRLEAAAAVQGYVPRSENATRRAHADIGYTELDRALRAVLTVLGYEVPQGAQLLDLSLDPRCRYLRVEYTHWSLRSIADGCDSAELPRRTEPQ